MDDNTQLRQFAATDSQEAFRELVERHTDLVYACAMQRLHDAQAAQDVSQAVFLTLALKAKDLRSHPSLAGWLFTTTRYVAARYHRGELRRKERERRAFEEHQSAAAEATAAAWEELQPHLAGALDSLSGTDREAVLLRFYRKASHQEVAAALGTSEDGARKRVDRALEKLRRFFTKKGVALSATALAGTLTANAAPAAPPGLAATASATALAGVSGNLTAASTMALAKGAMQMMFMAQLKTAALITAACVVVAGSGAIVAKEIAAPATPVAVAAEQEAPPLTTVTHDAATIAWGEAVDGLQAGLVTLGSDVAKDWRDRDFSCPSCSSRSIRRNIRIACKLCGVKDAALTSNPTCLSCAAKRRICTGCGTAKPWSATFIEGEPIRLEAHFKNVGKEAYRLLDAREGESWCFTFTPIGGGTPWVTHFRRESVRRLKTIEEVTVRLAAEGQDAVEHDLAQGWSFVDPQGRQPPNRALPVGKYMVTAGYAHPEHEQAKTCTYWHGTVTTGAVEIEIVPATNTEPAIRADWVQGAKVLMYFRHYPLIKELDGKATEEKLALAREGVRKEIIAALDQAGIKVVHIREEPREAARSWTYEAMMLLDCGAVEPEKALANVPYRIAGIVFQDGAFQRGLPKNTPDSSWMGKNGTVPAAYGFVGWGSGKNNTRRDDLARFAKLDWMKVEVHEPPPGTGGSAGWAILTPADGHTLLEVFLASGAGFRLVDPGVGAAVKQPGPESKATVKDGLQAVVRLDKAVYATNEPLTFTVIYTNVREKGNAFCLWDPGNFKDWKIMAGDWAVAGWPEDERKVDAAFLKTLGVGEQLEAPVKIGGDGAAHFFATVQRKPVPPRLFLPPGKYQLRLTIHLRETPLPLLRALPRWIGEISTEPVEFEVGDNAAAR